MVETLQNLEQVYARWQDKNPYNKQGSSVPRGLPQNYEKTIANGRQAWKSKFGDAIPPPRHLNGRLHNRRRNGGKNDYNGYNCPMVNLVVFFLYSGFQMLVNLNI